MVFKAGVVPATNQGDKMQNIIYSLLKRNILVACAFAVSMAILINIAFGAVGGLVFAGQTVNLANNLLDVAQLAVYVFTKLSTVKKLDRYDSPFILASLASLAF